jgi:hypothetical protein
MKTSADETIERGEATFSVTLIRENGVWKPVRDPNYVPLIDRLSPEGQDILIEAFADIFLARARATLKARKQHKRRPRPTEKSSKS